jgi:putative oxidoreductase
MKKLNALLAKVGSCLQSPVLLFVRLAWGFQLYESGWGHLTHFADTLKNFQGWNVPFPAASVYVAGTTEFVGGILLMLGLFSRFISIPLFFNFCVAYLTASPGELKALLHFKNPDDFINDAAFPFLVTSLLILAFGPGKISLDYLLEKFCGKKSGASGSGAGA